LGSEAVVDIQTTDTSSASAPSPAERRQISASPQATPNSRRVSSLIVQNVTSSWAVIAVSTLVSFLLAPLVVNGLGSVYYGIWVLLSQFTGYLWLFDFGVRDSVVKYVAQYHASGERDKLEATVRTAISVYTVVSLAVLGIIGCMVIALPYVFNIPADVVPAARIAAFVTGATIAQGFLTNVFVGVLVGLQRFYLVARASIYYSALRLVGTYLLLTNGYGLVGLSVLHFALSLFNAGCVVRLCLVYLPGLPLRPSRPVRAEVTRLLNYGKYVLMANIGDKIVFATDAIVIGMFLPIAALTPYAIAGTLIDSMRSVVRAMAVVFNPLTSSLRAGGHETALPRVLHAGAKGAMVVGLPICIGFITLGELFVSLWIGDAHAPMASRVMTVLSIGYIVGLPYYTISGILYGLAAHRTVAILRVVEGVTNLALSVALVKGTGLLGVALGTAIPHMIVVGWILPSALPRIVPVNLRAYYGAVYGRTLLASVPFVLACWLVRTVVQPADLASFFFWGLVSLPAYIAPAWLIALSAEERARALRVIAPRRGPRPARPLAPDIARMSSDNCPATRILYVEGNEDGTIGGSYLSLLFLVSGLDRTRFDPLVIFARENNLIPRFHERNVRTMVRPPARAVRWGGRVGRLCGKAVNFAILSFWQPLCLALLLRKEQVGLVHLNNTVRRNHPWMIAAWLARVPCITHERGINDEFSRRDQVLAPRLRAVICISRAVEDNFVARGLGDLNLLTIHNGLDPAEMRVTRDANELRAELGVSPTARLIGLVGNLKQWKGQELVIHAMDQLRDEFPDVVCLLIGDTSDDQTYYRREIEQLIDRHGLNNRVLITGFRSDVANYVNLLEIQVHASVSPEPFGRVLLEAMALCKPLVASNAGGVPEIVIDGTTGLLFEPKNVDALAGCLRQLLKDPARARMFGKAGRRRLETDFSITQNVTRTQALYSTLLAQ
jgi:glycosyltransferase involved in cell wall biosynthesis/O-antigen/teichoic acid export membrane protein